MFGTIAWWVKFVNIYKDQKISEWRFMPYHLLPHKFTVMLIKQILFRVENNK